MPLAQQNHPLIAQEEEKESDKKVRRNTYELYTNTLPLFAEIFVSLPVYPRASGFFYLRRNDDRSKGHQSYCCFSHGQLREHRLAG